MKRTYVFVVVSLLLTALHIKSNPELGLTKKIVDSSKIKARNSTGIHPVSPVGHGVSPIGTPTPKQESDGRVKRAHSAFELSDNPA